jgi:hypothetical protein
MSKKKRRGSKTAARRFASLRANKVNLASTTVANTINYDVAVREGKQIVAKMERDWRRLCELADGIETRYDDQTRQRFCAEIGVPYCTFERRMSVYQAWKSAPGPECYPSCFAVARELQSHPDRFEIIKNNPNITKREASELARQYREQDAGAEPVALPLRVSTRQSKLGARTSASTTKAKSSLSMAALIKRSVLHALRYHQIGFVSPQLVQASACAALTRARKNTSSSMSS